MSKVQNFLCPKEPKLKCINAENCNAKLPILNDSLCRYKKLENAITA